MLRRIILPLLILCAASVYSQGVTEIYGKVVDASTKEPLEYVTVKIVGVLRTTLTNPKGEYVIRGIEKIDSISFSYLGYKTRVIPVKRGSVQQLDVEMGSTDLTLTEVTVKAGKKKKRQIDTIANYVFYKVLENKALNRDNAINSYKYECYEKFMVSLLNTPEKFKNHWIFKPFRFAFRNTDTTEAGNEFIPGLLHETLSDVYYRKNPGTEKKIIKADMMSGVDNPSVGNLIDYQFTEIDAYDNIYLIASTAFAAPFANGAITTYFYYLTDTALIDGRVSYKLHFVGRVKEDLALKGHAWIDSATWAIQSIVFRPNEKANLNFINDYTIRQDYKRVGDKHWIKSLEETNSVGSLFKKKNKMSILVQKLVERRNFEIGIELADSIFTGGETRVLLDSARYKTTDYWDSARFEPLTPQEAMVYYISDTIKTVPAWKTYQWLGRWFTAAYADAGPISIGRVLNFISRNNVEGWRVRFGFETNMRFQKKGMPVYEFFRKWYFSGYGAYGFKDKDYKYMAMTRIALPRKNDRWQMLEAMYRYDMRVPGQDENLNLLTFDNFTTIISGTVLNKIMKTREFRISYEKEYIKDFSNITSMNVKTYYDIPGVFDFQRRIGENKIERISRFNVTEFMTDFRYSYRDQYYIGQFFRFFQTTRFPVIMLRYTAGVGTMGSDHFNYHNMVFTLRQRLFSKIGYTNYIFKAGKIFGTVPYTNAYLTQGNLGILYDKFNYNLLREFEFATDQYLSLWIEHNFDGFFFNKIPGLNKLKLREVITFKSLWGNFDKRKSEQLLAVPSELGQPFPIPYMELGFGIRNIGYVLRVDFIWRLTYRDRPNVPNWGVKLAFQPGF